MEAITSTIFSSSDLSQVSSVVWTIVGIIWLYTVLWTAKDIHARSDSTLFQLFCILLVLVASPIIGLPLYILLRPVGLKDETLGRQMVMDLESVPCIACMRPNLTGYDHCVFCGSTLKIQCKNCKEMYPHTHQYCYKCGAPNLTWKE